jgi:hypothetical protein
VRRRRFKKEYEGREEGIKEADSGDSIDRK